MIDNFVTFIELYGIYCFFLILGIGCVIFIFIEDRTKPFSKITISALAALILIPFLTFIFIAFINFSYLGYGYSCKGFEIIAKENNVLWSKDYSTLSSGGEGSSVMYRIKGLNVENGELLFTKLISDEVRVHETKNGIVWATLGEELIGMNLLTGKDKIVITEKELMKRFPELSSGVYEYTYNEKTSLVDIKSKDGLTLSIDPEANIKVIPAEDRTIRDKYNVSGLGVFNNLGKILITLRGKGEREYLETKDSVLNPGLFFLKGKIVMFDTVTTHVFTMSYETLEKENVIMRCVSLEGKLIWEAKQKELKVGDFFNPIPDYKISFFYKDKMIVVFDGFVVSLDKVNGKIGWLARL